MPLDSTEGLALSNPLSAMGLDLRGLASSDNQEEQISRIATQFEEMLLHNLIKETFKTPSLFGEDGDSAWMSTMSSLQPMLLSQYLAEQGGLGYRQVIEYQLLEKIRQFSPQNESQYKELQLAPLSFVPKIPVSGTISSAFGWRQDPFSGKEAFHSGIDIAIPEGTSVQSIGPGQVIFSGTKPGYGEVVEIDHGQGVISRYAHNESNLVRTGDLVGSGSVIARSGSSGRSTGPHLHLEIRKDGQPVNPEIFFGSV